jgi:hypothetical protein
MDHINFGKLEKYISGTTPDHFINEPGTEAYALYSDLSLKLQTGKIADLGTYQGLSALAFAYNPKVQVVSYDIDLANNLVSKRKNIEFIEGNIFDKANLKTILDCDIILVDLDPHDGIQEQKFLDILIEKSYKGITLWDDIHLNSGMKNFWYKVQIEKEDISNIGHHSGTGKIIFQ